MLGFIKGIFSPKKMVWAILSRRFKRGRDISAVLYLTKAYRRLFTDANRATNDDAMYVLCDLAIASGAFGITQPSPDISDKDIWFNEGKKALFFHILQAAQMSPEHLQALQQAAMHEEQYLKQGNEYVDSL